MFSKIGSMASLEQTADGELHADLAHLSFDQRLTNKIMAKRKQEMERRSRLLDPRKHKYGVQHDVLDAQLLEKRATQDKEVQEETYFAKSAKLQEQVAQAVEVVQAQAAKDRKLATVDYTMRNCRKEQRREYELSDPTAIKREKAPTWDDICKLGPSSMLKFDGDCNDEQAKKHAQHAATRAWLQEQIDAKKRKEQEEKERDRRFDEELMLANQVRGLCEQAALEEARQEKLLEQAENAKIAEMHAKRKQLRHEKHVAACHKHVQDQLNDERLQEKVDSVIGGNGRLAEFKRLSQAQRQDVWNTNGMIILDKQARKAAEQEEGMMHADQIRKNSEILGALETEKVRMVRERRLKAEEENRVLAIERRQSDAFDRRAYKSFTVDEPPRSHSSLW
eukprot:TRINITY_DN19497_c0_g1_i1.p1 TRINITY_DN19497_c0_g1~~TRINITY_DN19497_c0_g1_i1.p1  ORF type:complete len:393 (+),score=160.01 TRINITY_DN19497_c0_g1_i1:143-1321(+)